MKRTFFTVHFVFWLLVSTTVFAHYASVTVDNYHPDPGEEITIHIGFGHKFPADGEMRRAAYDSTILSIINPKGKVQIIKVVPNEEQGNHPIKVKLTQEGRHTIILSQKNFSTKTTRGYKYQPKNELRDVLHSKWSETVSKAIVNVGSTENHFKPVPTKDRFQVTLMQNPLTVDKSDYLSVKVTFDNKPFKGKIVATYDGFSDIRDTFCYVTPTDKDGVAKIKLIEKGLWLIKTDHTCPYKDLDKADEYSFKATATFKN